MNKKYSDLEYLSLGLLRYNDRYDWYEGQIIFQTLEVSIKLATDDEGNIKSILDRANYVVVHLEIYSENAKDYAVEKLLKLKNEAWLDENEELLTPTQFKNRMILESINISSEGDLNFYYNDGDLFFGHCISITINNSDRFVDANSVG
jgi:hypothetical protein